MTLRLILGLLCIVVCWPMPVWAGSSWGDMIWGEDDWYIQSTGNPPFTPTPVTPADEGMVAPGSVVLETSSYSDPEEDAHYKTYWWIRRADRHAYTDKYTTSGLTKYQIDNLQAGMCYVWRVGYKDYGSRQISWSSENRINVGTMAKDTSLEMAAGDDRAAFKIISIPYWPNRMAAETFFRTTIGGEYSNGLFRIGTYDPLLGRYVECDDGLEIQPGIGYWFLSRNGATIEIEGVAVGPDMAIDVALKYDPETDNGWNMVGSPNNADYQWSDVELLQQDDDGNTIYGPVPISNLNPENEYLDTRLWRYSDGIYHSDTLVLKAFSGFWIRAKKVRLYLRFQPQNQTQQTSHIFDPGTWRRSLIAWIRNGWWGVSHAHAEDDEQPPAPMGTFDTSSSGDTTAGGGGCFIQTAIKSLPQ